MYLDLKNINYCYIVYHDDEFKFIEHIFDTESEIANYFNKSLSAVSRFLSRQNTHKSTLRYEKVQIHDYCFVVYKNNLNDFKNYVFVSKNLQDISKRFKVPIKSLKISLRNFLYPNLIHVSPDCRIRYKFINGKYELGVIDLWDLDTHSLETIAHLIENGKSEELEL